MKKYIIIFIIYFLFSLLSFKDYLIIEGVIGLRQDWGIPVYNVQFWQKFYQSFYVWNYIEGFPIPSYYTRQYYAMFEAVVFILSGQNTALMSKLITPIMMSLAGLFMFVFLNKININEKASFISGLFYIYNPLMYNKVIAGHHLYIFSYMLTPLILLFLILFIKNKDTKYILLSSIFYAMTSTQIQFPLMLIFMISTILFIFNVKKRFFIRILTFYLVIFVFLNFHWITVTLFDLYNAILPSYLASIALIDYHEIIKAPSTVKAFFMIGYNQKYDYYNLYLSNVLDIKYFIFNMGLIIVSYFALIFYKGKIKKHFIIISIIYILIGIFIVTSINGVYPLLWRTLYVDLHILKLFRETYHATFLILFGTTILLAIVIDIIIKSIKYKYIVITLFTLLIILSSTPMLMSYIDSIQVIPRNEEMSIFFEELYKDKNYYKVFYLPTISPVKYDGIPRPSIDIVAKYSVKPTYPIQARNIGINEIIPKLIYYYSLYNKTDKLKRFYDILAKTGLKYIICRPNDESHYVYYVPMYRYFKDLSLDLSVMEKWKNTTYICDKTFDSIYPINIKKYNYFDIIEIENSENYITLCYRPIIVEDFTTMLKSSTLFQEECSIIASLSNAEILKYHKISNSSMLYIIENDYKLRNIFFMILKSFYEPIIISPTSGSHKINEGWANSLTSWYIDEQLITAISDGNVLLTYDTYSSIDIKLNDLEPGEYYIYFNILKSPLAGAVKVSINNNTYYIKTKLVNNESSRFVWLNLNKINIENYMSVIINITNIEGLNAIRYIVIAKTKDVKEAENLLNRYISEKKIIVVKLDEINNSFVNKVNFDKLNIKYRQLSPTKWKILIDNTKNVKYPFIIVFNEPYDSMWRAKIREASNTYVYDEEEKSPLQIYGLVNGYLISLKGIGKVEVEIYYKRQFYFDIGLLVSFISLFILSLYMFYMLLYQAIFKRNL